MASGTLWNSQINYHGLAFVPRRSGSEVVIIVLVVESCLLRLVEHSGTLKPIITASLPDLGFESCLPTPAGYWNAQTNCHSLALLPRTKGPTCIISRQPKLSTEIRWLLRSPSLKEAHLSFNF